MTQRRALLRIACTLIAALTAWIADETASCALPLEAVPTAAPVSGLAPDALRVEIHWDAPAECPDLSAVREHAERLLGQSLDAPRTQQIVARAKVHRNEAGNWELWLSLTANNRVAQETLIAKQCRALADATALKVALAIDPVATAHAIEVATVDTVPSPRPAAIRQPSPDQPSTSTPVSSSGGVRLAGGAAVGLLPGIGGGAGLTLWLQHAPWRAELAGQGFWGGDAHDERLATVGAHLQLFSGSARGCRVVRAGSVEFPLCLGAELGVMHGAGFGLENTEKSNSWWAALVFGPALRLPLSDAISLWFAADGVVPLLRPGFTVRNLGTLYTAAPGSARAWVGCEFRLSR